MTKRALIEKGDLSKREELEIAVALAEYLGDIFLELSCMGLSLSEAKRQVRMAMNRIESYDDLDLVE